MDKSKLIIAKVILFLFSIVFLFSLYNIIVWYCDSKETNNMINRLQQVTSIHASNDGISTQVLDRTDYYDEKFLNVDFTNLLKENEDVVGWIQILGTNIDYPFVQYKNNDYYLTHSFDKSRNLAGWLFLDYRNSIDFSDRNTIIYAHGRVDGTMFGSLKNILDEKWLSSEKPIIKISTLTYRYIFEIFSAYHISTTNDYLITNFSEVSEYSNFLKTIQSRSMVRFNVPVTTNNKIITLSTCYNNSEKMVVHAKLIKQEKCY